MLLVWENAGSAIKLSNRNAVEGSPERRESRPDQLEMSSKEADRVGIENDLFGLRINYTIMWTKVP